MNIFVANINYRLESEDLKALFEDFGEVSSAKVIYDHMTGKSRGFGFVEMPDEEAAQQAIEYLNERDVEGKTLTVKKARPRSQNNNRGGGGYNRNQGDRGFYNR